MLLAIHYDTLAFEEEVIIISFIHSCAWGEYGGRERGEDIMEQSVKPIILL